MSVTANVEVKKVRDFLKSRRLTAKCCREIKTVNHPNGVTYAYLWEIFNGITKNDEVLLAVMDWTNKEMERLEQIETALIQRAETINSKLLSFAN